MNNCNSWSQQQNSLERRGARSCRKLNCWPRGRKWVMCKRARGERLERSWWKGSKQRWPWGLYFRLCLQQTNRTKINRRRGARLTTSCFRWLSLVYPTRGEAAHETAARRTLVWSSGVVALVVDVLLTEKVFYWFAVDGLKGRLESWREIGVVVLLYVGGNHQSLVFSNTDTITTASAATVGALGRGHKIFVISIDSNSFFSFRV